CSTWSASWPRPPSSPGPLSIKDGWRGGERTGCLARLPLSIRSRWREGRGGRGLLRTRPVDADDIPILAGCLPHVRFPAAVVAVRAPAVDQRLAFHEAVDERLIRKGVARDGGQVGGDEHRG